MKKFLFLFICLLSFFIVSEEKGYAQNIEKEYLTEEFLRSLTIDDFVVANVIIESRFDITQLTEDELNEQAALVLNEIYQNKIIPFANNNDLPETYGGLNKWEIAIAILSPFQATQVYSASNAAKKATATFFQNPKADDHNGNAFKHSYWNGLMMKKMSESDTQLWADAHEMSSTNDLATAMDLYNNAYGRNVYKTLGKPTDAQLSAKLLNDITKGQLKRVVNNKLIGTNGTGRN